MQMTKKCLLITSIGLALSSCGGGSDNGDEVIAVFGSNSQGPSEYDIQTKAARDAFEARLAEAQTVADEWMDNNRQAPNVVTTQSGLQYRVNKSSPNLAGQNYEDGQDVTVHYEGRLIDGSIFDSSFDRGRPEILTPSELIQGWQEALSLMHPGDEWTLYIPPSLGYGDLGKGGGIPPNAVLIFDVELR